MSNRKETSAIVKELGISKAGASAIKKSKLSMTDLAILNKTELKKILESRADRNIIQTWVKSNKPADTKTDPKAEAKADDSKDKKKKDKSSKNKTVKPKEKSEDQKKEKPEDVKKNAGTKEKKSRRWLTLKSKGGEKSKTKKSKAPSKDKDATKSGALSKTEEKTKSDTASRKNGNDEASPKEKEKKRRKKKRKTITSDEARAAMVKVKKEEGIMMSSRIHRGTEYMDCFLIKDLIDEIMGVLQQNKKQAISTAQAMLDHGYLGGFKGETKIEMNRAFFTFKKPDEVIEPLDLTVKQSEPKTSKKKEASVSIEPSEFKKKDVPAKIEPAKEMEKHKKVHMHEPAEEKLFSKPSPAISQPPKEDMAMTKTAQQVASNNDGTLDEIEKLKRQIAEQERVRLQLELKLAEQKAVTAANEIKVAEAIAAAKAVAADPSLKMEPKVVTKKAAIVIETSSACEDSDEYYSDSYYQTDYYSDTDVDSDYDNSESSEKPKPAAKLTSAVAKAGAADSKACIAERSDAKTGVGREKSERVMKLMSKFENSEIRCENCFQMKKNVKKVKGTDVCPDCYDEYIAQMSSSESEEVSKICICLKQDLNVDKNEILDRLRKQGAKDFGVGTLSDHEIRCTDCKGTFPYSTMSRLGKDVYCPDCTKIIRRRNRKSNKT